MSYQVLARKWRPKRFAELVGQEHVVKALTNALDTDRVHHAYLFTGTRGVGKTTIARIFAKSLNCEKGQSAEPCGQCAACKAIDEGRFVDLLEIDAASNTGVDDVRQVIENAQYAPTQGRFKVYLIDEVHMLSTSAFNALLKTLEEPPAHVKFLLATTDPQKLPATVLSRCLKFDLKQLLPQQIAGQMRFILDAEGIEGESAAIDELAHAADGSMRDGLSLLDQAIAHGDGHLQASSVRVMLGRVDGDSLLQLLEALAEGDGKQLIAKSARLAEYTPDFAHVLDALAGLLHRLQLYQLIDNYTEDAPDRDKLKSLAGRFAAEDVQLYYQLVLNGQRELVLAPNMYTGFEMTLLRMLAFKPKPAYEPITNDAQQNPNPSASQAGAKKAADKVSPPSTKTPHQKAPTTNSSKPEQAESNAGKLEDESVADSGQDYVRDDASKQMHFDPLNEWEKVIELSHLQGGVRQLAVNAHVKSWENQRLTLEIPPKRASLALPPLIKQLENQLATVLGNQFKLHLEHSQVSVETPAGRLEKQQQQRQQQAQKAIDEDPLIATMKQEFGATVVADSVQPYSP